MRLGVWALALAWSPAFSQAATAPAVESVTPTGSVKNVRQVRVRFTTAMKPLGSAKESVKPFELECSKGPKGKAIKAPEHKTRWADSKNWILEFARPLASGLRCALRFQHIRDLSGAEVRADDSYSFTTGGPSLLNVHTASYRIDPDQHFVAVLDGKVSEASVISKAYFEVEGMPDKNGVRVVKGALRENTLRAAIANEWSLRKFRPLLKTPGAMARSKELASILVLTGERRFPEKAKVIFHWPKGILSTNGAAVEEAQRFNYTVIEPFTADFSCERVAVDRACNPVTSMYLGFSNAVALERLKGARLVSSKGEVILPEELKPKPKDAKDAPGPMINSLTFKAPFSERAEFKLILPPGVSDEMGRRLSNASRFPLEIATDEYAPLVKFSGPFGLLELKAQPALPVSVRNVEKSVAGQRLTIDGKRLKLGSKESVNEILKMYRAVLDKQGYSNRDKPLLTDSRAETFRMPKPLGERPLELVGIPFTKPGFYVIELASPRLGKALLDGPTMYVNAAALVTDLAVHLKRGRESSLVWVTSLHDAKPVADAKISLVGFEGDTLAEGRTDKNGILRIGKLKIACEDDGYYGSSENSCTIYAFAQKGEDISFVSSAWSKGIEGYRFEIEREYFSKDWGPTVLHTVFDRMVAQPGEVVNMKHVLRDHVASGFALMDSARLPKRVLIVHNESRKTFTLPFEYDPKMGVALNRFNIPKDATLGRYSVYLSNRDKVPQGEDSFDWSSVPTGNFIVSEYRLPLMKAAVKVQSEPLIRAQSVSVDLSAAFLSGGPAKDLPVRLRATLSPDSMTPDIPGASEYRFFSSPVKTGWYDNQSEAQTPAEFLHVSELKLDANGGRLAKISGLPVATDVKSIQIEMEYTDPNGEVKSAGTTARIFPAEYAIGLRSDSWLNESSRTRVLGVISDLNGKVKAGQAYTVEAFATKHFSHRKRLVGGYYSYSSKSRVYSIGKICSGVSDKDGRFLCRPKSLPPGHLNLQAQTVDSNGRTTYAVLPISVYADGDNQWIAPSDSDRIDLLPERTRYEPGQAARIAVRSPFAASTVLVTVEREGVLDGFVAQITRDKPDVSVPIKGNFAPNIFVGALAVRGRVGEPQPTALLDLARPSMKMGLVELKVGWKAHELGVSVKTDKPRYSARDKVRVKIKVSSPDGSAAPKGSEVAVAAVDEALMRLRENTSWKLIDEMMGHRGIEVSTSSAQNQVIGKRHFGAKAKAPGGGGGETAADPRSLFEPVVLWEPRLKLNADGEAEITVPLNDSMTSFRIVAVATGGTGLFGTGSANVEASKDLILYSGFSPMAREGDLIGNAFTVRNTTSKPMKVAVEVTATGMKGLPKLPMVSLNPSESRTLEIPITVPSDVRELSFQIRARDTLAGTAADAMLAKVRVDPAVPVRVQEATLFQLDKTAELSVESPAGALPGRGGIRASGRASLVSGLTGVKAFMADYPYSCFEQRLSKAIVAEEKKGVQAVIEMMPAYQDPGGLIKFFPTSSCGSAQLTAYTLNILQDNQFTIPKPTLSAALDGLRQHLEGKRICENWFDKYFGDAYQIESRLPLFETLSRYGAFDKSMLATIQITPNLWTSEALVAWNRLLMREKDIPERDSLLKRADEILRSRLAFSGSVMTLQSKLDGLAEWRLFTSPDQEALGVLAIALDGDTWNEDVSRMVRGVVARLRQGHWDTTTANALGVTQLRRFSAKFEKDTLSGETQVQAPGGKLSFDWKRIPQGSVQELPWPKGRAAVAFMHKGTGKPWMHLESRAAIPLVAPLDMGYKISRKITPVTQAVKGKWSQGDVANVELTIVAGTDQPWVVVRDPVPAGATHLGTGLDGSSRLLDRDPKARASDSQPWPTESVEKSFADFISYAAYLPRGTYILNYRIRLNSTGEFKLPPTRVEAMYSPEVFGEAPIANWIVSR